MEIKNYYVSDVKMFKEWLITELILAGISYVCVENEIHYGNKIIRFNPKTKTKKSFTQLFPVVEKQLEVPNYFTADNKVDNYSKFNDYYKNPAPIYMLKKGYGSKRWLKVGK